MFVVALRVDPLSFALRRAPVRFKLPRLRRSTLTPHILHETKSGKPIMATATFLNLLAAASGAFTHLAVFRKGEWDVAAPSVFALYSSIFAAALLSTFSPLINVSTVVVTQLAICHVAGLYTSMVLYRSFFHRLSQYPGPFLARVTNFYITALSMKKLHLFEEIQKLHAQYGDYVRVGKWQPAVSLEHDPLTTVSQAPGSSPLLIQRLSRSSMAARLPLSKARGTRCWNHGCLFSWPVTSRNMHVAARSGIRGSPPKVNLRSCVRLSSTDMIQKQSRDMMVALQKPSTSCCLPLTERKLEFWMFPNGFRSLCSMSWKTWPSTNRRICWPTARRLTSSKPFAPTCSTLLFSVICLGCCRS